MINKSNNIFNYRKKLESNLKIFINIFQGKVSMPIRTTRL